MMLLKGKKIWPRFDIMQNIFTTCFVAHTNLILKQKL